MHFFCNPLQRGSASLSSPLLFAHALCCHSVYKLRRQGSVAVFSCKVVPITSQAYPGALGSALPSPPPRSSGASEVFVSEAILAALPLTPVAFTQVCVCRKSVPPGSFGEPRHGDRVVSALREPFSWHLFVVSRAPPLHPDNA